MSKDGSFSYVQPAEGDGPEIDGPNVLGDFFKPKVFASQQVGDIDPGGVPADPAIGGDAAGLVVRRILGQGELARVWPGRGFVGGRGRLLPQGLVGPDLVEVGPERIEAPLLSGSVPGRRDAAS